MANYNDYIAICTDAWFNLEVGNVHDFLRWWTETEDEYDELVDDIYLNTDLNEDEGELYKIEPDDDRLVEYFLTHHNDEIELWLDHAMSDRFSQWSELDELEYEEQIDYLVNLWDNRYDYI